MINGKRIEQARKLSGLTQKQLALKVDINQSSIAQFEADICSPTVEVLKAIATITGFQPFFFYKPSLTDFSSGSLSYRSKKTVSAKELDAAYQYALLIYEHVAKMAEDLSLPQVNLSILNEKPQQAAEITRVNLGLSPDSSILNLTNTIEKNGVILLSLPLFLPKMDAFSTWANIRGLRPIIALSHGKSGDRLRFSIAHELGHLVMHQPAKGNIKQMEKEANEFAEELLLPKSAMAREFIRPISLYSLAKLKGRWGVSMQALIYRAYSLNIITERQKTYLFTQMSSHGWRIKEPSNLDIKIETPQIVRKMIETLYDNPESYASDMGLRIERATELTLYA